MEMEELLRRAGETIKKSEKELLVSKGYEENECLLGFTRGVKSYYSYTCLKCGETSLISENEADFYIESSTKKTQYYSRNKIVTCPNCGERSDTKEARRIVGTLKAFTDGKNFVDLYCNAKTYPDSEVITTCKLSELSYKDIYDHESKKPEKHYWYSDYVEDLTDWEVLYKDYEEIDKDEEHKKVRYFLSGLKANSGQLLLCYLFIRETPTLFRVITECNDSESISIIREMFQQFINKNAVKNKISILKTMIKNKKDLTEQRIKDGEVFVMTKDIMKRCDSLEKVNSLRKLYKKYDDVKEFEEIMEGAAISEDAKYLNSLRIALDKISVFDAKYIAKICIMQYVLGGYEYNKTCQMLSKNADKSITNFEFFKPTLMEADWVQKQNNWTFSLYDDEKRLKGLQDSLNEANPDDEVVLSDDLYEFEKDYNVLKNVAKKESIYFNALITLYRNNIAFIYTTFDKTKYIFARNTGEVLIKGAFS
jgi:hypothetical protein